MNSIQVRKTFLDFFAKKQHQIVSSAPLVVKNDPTLMFTNAGMNQFKDIFLGNTPVKYSRIANSQKCLRVSGKHNDLEDVGKDTYHHTMFEMLGNWSFGDYFKKEAIQWAWELLTDVYKIEKSNLYVTVFGGDKSDNLDADNEAYNFWKIIVPESCIIYGSKKDNFWEMGDTVPCGPCSEIHIDLRSEDEKQKIAGRDLVNKDHPHVIEIWNLVFIEFNRSSSGALSPLPAKHVDTGMGFERLNMVLQGKKSNYDTDVFQPIIQEIAKQTGFAYGKEQKVDIAIRVIADHLRAIAFAIADGQLPSNVKAGYVIRRILRRAVRYAFTYLDCKEPLLNKLFPTMVQIMGEAFPEILKQQDLITKVIAEEENSFLRTLAVGIQKFENFIELNANIKQINGSFAFELFDTYGFPIDLTQLMASEKGWTVDMVEFAKNMDIQKNRSRQAGEVKAGDWVELKNAEESIFIGYDMLECEAEIIKYRNVKSKDGEFCHIVIDRTPFYGESGGQVGDKGTLIVDGNELEVINTVKENNLTVHITKKIDAINDYHVYASVNQTKRQNTANNHSATHLLHSALRAVLGSHVEQKGSMVSDEKLRFDFSHFAKLTEDEVAKVEVIVNKKIRENILIEEMRSIPIQEAQNLGAIALFGEKYGENVRVIAFNRSYSMELCGGTHVAATGNIGWIKILSESAIAAGMRRIEAVTGEGAEEWLKNQNSILENIANQLKGSKDFAKSIANLIQQNADLEKKVDILTKEKLQIVKSEILKELKSINGINIITKIIEADATYVKDLAYAIKSETAALVVIIGSYQEDKANLTILISEDLVESKKLNAADIIKKVAKEINGGGGGQAFFATAGGKNPAGLENAINLAHKLILEIG